ncbi:hypothetical protein HYPSUDRAFT_46174 [Hypholoma sublateritium FD-334 SS-4]|uniref:Uncharacterized protein n=1 Tax=Hypholoma sublateritium (strain FD-334 SS-4) TaxID=945553 RepID=A0A0D2KSU4_HYPSF|nr:hypothetical protein HYPSUDRAFT_46174 [Hypholoma sublateritium FD-334 SS-4]
MLYYRKLADINKGKWANYTDDRIVFYENDYTGRDFVEFFKDLQFSKATCRRFNFQT